DTLRAKRVARPLFLGVLYLNYVTPDSGIGSGGGAARTGTRPEKARRADSTRDAEGRSAARRRRVSGRGDEGVRFQSDPGEERDQHRRPVLQEGQLPRGGGTLHRSDAVEQRRARSLAEAWRSGREAEGFEGGEGSVREVSGSGGREG